MMFCEGIAEIDWKAFAALLTASAAWTVAFLTFKIAKGYWKTNRNLELLKIKEEWLKELREAMSEYISEGITNGQSSTGRKRFYALHTKILLMMNPELNDPVKLNDKNANPYYIPYESIKNLMNEIGKKWMKSEKVEADLSELRELFHKYLKYHWDLLQKEVREI